MRTGLEVAGPEIYFRIVHLAQEGQIGAPVAANREQTVEVSLGLKGAFENGNIGVLKRRAPPDQIVCAVLTSRSDPKLARVPKTLRVTELLRKAIEWQALLESGKIANQAEIACQEGISRARVTQIMGMLRLVPEIQEKIRTSPSTLYHGRVTERMLRPIGTIIEQRDQVREFHRFLLK